MKKTIIISGVNLSEGGPLTVIKSVLEFLDNSTFVNDYKIIALIYSKQIFNGLNNIELIEFPNIKSSWKNRMKFEYIECKKISKKLNSYLWLSLHDISPNIISKRRAVYCHNPSPFYKQNNSEFFKDPLRFLYTKFYKQLYKINIHKNDYVIVQQKWIKDGFVRFFKLEKDKVIVSLPLDSETENIRSIVTDREKAKIFTFFYPAFPREFKNFEIICKAVMALKSNGVNNFRVKLTIDGSENAYSNKIVREFSKYPEIEFVGLLSKEKVEENYVNSDCLIFPSKLETWGLPISEYKKYKKTMLVADLPYAYETVGDYDRVRYFNVTKVDELSECMFNVMNGNIEYTNKGEVKYEDPICRNWDDLFKVLLK